MTSFNPSEPFFTSFVAKAEITLKMDSNNNRVAVVARLRSFSRAGDVVCAVASDSRTVSVTDPIGRALLNRLAPHSLGAGGGSALSAKHKNFFSLDRVFTGATSQGEVYEQLGVVDNALDGFNVTVFAYGQSGSGKTYTMVGPNISSDKLFVKTSGSKLLLPSSVGLIPRVCGDLFARLEREQQAGHSDNGVATTRVETVVTVSFLEIYCEAVYDLLALASVDGSAEEALDPSSPSRHPSGGVYRSQSQSSLRLREHPTRGVFVEGLTELSVSSAPEALAVLAAGCNARAVAETRLNAASSRGHAVFTLTLSQRTVDAVTGLPIHERQSKITMVDLAGSERSEPSAWGLSAEPSFASTTSSGAAPASAPQAQAARSRQREMAKINTSLSALGAVIKALSKQQPQHPAGAGAFVPYRNSVLTWLLKDSLGGNSKTTMIATISPLASSYAETLSTLKYCESVKRIAQHAVPNEGLRPDDSARVISELRAEIEYLRGQLSLKSFSVSAGCIDSDAVGGSESFIEHSQRPQEEEQQVDAADVTAVTAASEPAMMMLAQSSSSSTIVSSSAASPVSGSTSQRGRLSYLDVIGTPHSPLAGSLSQKRHNTSRTPISPLPPLSDALVLMRAATSGIGPSFGIDSKLATAVVSPLHKADAPYVASPLAASAVPSPLLVPPPSSASKTLPSADTAQTEELVAHLQHRERLVAHLLTSAANSPYKRSDRSFSGPAERSASAGRSRSAIAAEASASTAPSSSVVTASVSPRSPIAAPAAAPLHARYAATTVSPDAGRPFSLLPLSTVRRRSLPHQQQALQACTVASPSTAVNESSSSLHAVAVNLDDRLSQVAAASASVTDHSASNTRLMAGTETQHTSVNASSSASHQSSSSALISVALGRDEDGLIQPSPRPFVAATRDLRDDEIAGLHSALESTRRLLSQAEVDKRALKTQLVSAQAASASLQRELQSVRAERDAAKEEITQKEQLPAAASAPLSLLPSVGTDSGSSATSVLEARALRLRITELESERRRLIRQLAAAGRPRSPLPRPSRPLAAVATAGASTSTDGNLNVPLTASIPFTAASLQNTVAIEPSEGTTAAATEDRVQRLRHQVEQSTAYARSVAEKAAAALESLNSLREQLKRSQEELDSRKAEAEAAQRAQVEAAWLMAQLKEENSRLKARLLAQLKQLTTPQQHAALAASAPSPLPSPLPSVANNIPTAGASESPINAAASHSPSSIAPLNPLDAPSPSSPSASVDNSPINVNFQTPPPSMDSSLSPPNSDPANARADAESTASAQRSMPRSRSRSRSRSHQQQRDASPSSTSASRSMAADLEARLQQLQARQRRSAAETAKRLSSLGVVSPSGS